MNLPNYLITSTDVTLDSSYNVFKHNESSEQRVIRQLCEALLFENIIRYELDDSILTFKIGEDTYQAKGYISGFSRIRLDGPTILQKQDSQLIPPKLSKIIASLPAEQKTKERLQEQLTQTIKLCEWNSLHPSSTSCRRKLSYRELESAIDEGHPYHPCFKSRTGFSLKDHALYGPEQGNLFQLHWLAVERRYLKQNLDKENDSLFWQKELGIGTWAHLQQIFSENDITWQDYGLLPIHPWQWHNLQHQLVPVLEKRHLIYLGNAGDFYQASISVRTLLNVSDSHKANVKLPLNMVNTSSLRTIESHSICTAPIISDWLQEMIDGDKFINQHCHLGILPEYAGIVVKDKHTEQDENHWSKQLDGQLGVIFRQSVAFNHDENTVIPFVALAVTETDGNPFIHHWIEKYDCEDWLTQLIDVAIIPVWHLLVHHGIALEAHAQNLILVHDQGWPQKILLRDFHESLEYVESYIANPQIIPDFLSLEKAYQNAQPDQFYWMENVEALRELLVDTLFVFNLTDLAVLLEKHYLFSENDFWQLVYQRVKNYNQAGYTDSERIQKIDIFQTEIQTESLIRKKLSKQVGQEFHHFIDNPLASVMQEELSYSTED